MTRYRRISTYLWQQFYIYTGFSCVNIEGALINIFYNGVMWKGLLVVTNPKSSVPLNSPENFSVFQLAVLVFLWPANLFQFALSNLTSLVSVQWKCSDKPTVHCLPSTKQETDKVSDSLVNIVEQQLVETKRRENIRLETWLQMNVNVTPCLLRV